VRFCKDQPAQASQVIVLVGDHGAFFFHSEPARVAHDLLDVLQAVSGG
jgi:hypothetical protein